MILAAHQPVYLPWLGLFHKIALADMFISFNQVQYQPKDWNNRNKIKTNNGSIWLSVPVMRSVYLDKTISEIEIDNSKPWAKKHWKSISLAYSKAPYFNQYRDFFEDVYSKKWMHLVDLNQYMLQGFLDILGIHVTVRRAEEWKFKGEKSDLVLNMCQQVEADSYIFGAQGIEYADVNSFNQAGVTPYFQEYKHPFYSQLHGEFEPCLSILDLLFNCGDSSLDILMSDNVKDILVK